jgi:hypothetical protein
MKFATTRPYANPEAAARKLIEIANAVEAVQDNRIHIELLNGPIAVRTQGDTGRIQRRPQVRDRARLRARRRQRRGGSGLMIGTVGVTVSTRNAPKHHVLRFAKLDRMVLEPNT